MKQPEVFRHRNHQGSPGIYRTSHRQDMAFPHFPLPSRELKADSPKVSEIIIEWSMRCVWRALQEASGPFSCSEHLHEDKVAQDPTYPQLE